MASIVDDLQQYVDRSVVLDTAGPIVYLGTLVKVTENGFWLKNADVHDCRDGHATKEVYVADASVEGTNRNRKRVFVMRPAVVSVSLLSDVVCE